MKENKSRPNTAEEFLEEIKSTASRLQDDGISRGDAKLLSTALKELRYCFQVFSRYQNKKKVSIFGSARTPPEHPTYVQAMEFGRKCRTGLDGDHRSWGRDHGSWSPRCGARNEHRFEHFAPF
ncbi:MAG: hypothetical protein R3B84_08170 [Zavarzinella sp.]